MNRISMLLVAALGAALPVTTFADAGHSLEADQHTDGSEGEQARKRAAERVTWRDERARQDPVVKVKLLGINDFHGQLSAKTVSSRPAGGAAVLASYLKVASAAAEDGALIIHAGDHVGASPPNSALLQDEPAISVLNTLANEHCRSSRGDHAKSAHAPSRCNVVGTFGNHEFDEGIDEALRLVRGGNHADGPFLEAPWRGASFPYVSANVVDAESGEPVLPPYVVHQVEHGVRIGVIGAVLKETPTIVTPTGVAGLSFLDEADAINTYVGELKQRGVQTIVVTIHQGTGQTSYSGATDPARQDLTGSIVDIVQRLDDAVDVVISGHAHGFTNVLLPNRNGKPILVVQAYSASTAYDDIDLTISRKSGDVVAKSAAVVTTWADEGPGLSPDAKVAQIVAAADAEVAPLVSRVVGVASSAISRTENAAGESALGNLIADAQRASGESQFAFMNPGGIRDDLAAGEVTWGELFAIQPFANDLVSMDLTGAQIEQLLEQQWLGQTSARILKTSGLTYTWDASRAVGDRIVSIADAQGNALVPTATYRVTVNSFMAAGGDGFTVLTAGTNRVVGAVDLDALVTHIEGLTQPFSAQVQGRIVRVD